MFNRAAFCRTAFNRSVDVAATDINYNDTMTANSEQATRLSAHLKHMANVVQSLSKAVNLCAGILLSATGATTAETDIGMTTVLFAAENGYEEVHSNAQLTRHYTTAITANAQINRLLYCAAGYYGGITIPATMSAILTGASYIVVISQDNVRFNFSGRIFLDNLLKITDYVSLNADFALALNYLSSIKALSEFKKSVGLSVSYTASYNDNFRNGYATLKAYISSETAIDYVFEINCLLPAGATLVIDSEDFTATIDGENVLYAQKGKWIFITRNTQQISLDITDFVNTENIEGRISYRDRYL